MKEMKRVKIKCWEERWKGGRKEERMEGAHKEGRLREGRDEGR